MTTILKFIKEIISFPFIFSGVLFIVMGSLILNGYRTTVTAVDILTTSLKTTIQKEENT